MGYGKTEKKALSELLEAITCHLSFAKSRNDDTLLPFPAPREFYDKWETAHADALKNEISQAKFKAMAIKAIWIAVDRHLTAAPKARFAAVELSCA